jgi:hypothetical protein
MATTYTLISSNVLSSSAASVTFSAIPSTYTDLVLRWSARLDTTSSEVDLRFNSDSATNYSSTRIVGNGATASSLRISSANNLRFFESANYSTDTANTFNSMEIYIPSYTVSQNKPFSSFVGTETNATTAYLVAQANLWSNTAAITSIVLDPISSANFVAGSSFYLYGIKNS